SCNLRRAGSSKVMLLSGRFVCGHITPVTQHRLMQAETLFLYLHLLNWNGCAHGRLHLDKFTYAHDLFTLFLGLITIKEAHDIEARLNEVEKLLKTIINMPWKYSRSEVVLTFFERSPLDQVLKNDNVHKIQPSFQSPVKISEIMRSNGFCLANTETIVIDHSIPNGKEKHLDVDSAEHLFESVSDFTSELEDSDDPTAYVTNLTYYHLVPFETDILD
uniref:PXDC1 protein n=1 Tax=Coturnix japonica TaxID=93934 RepID=A0A8C2U2H7_COTJA